MLTRHDAVAVDLFASSYTSTYAGALTYTPAAVAAGFILRDPNGGSRSDVLPTVTDFLNSYPNLLPGDSLEFTIKNTADAAETITVGAGTGGATSGTMTIAQNNCKRFIIVFTGNADPSKVDGYTAYGLGTLTF